MGVFRNRPRSAPPSPPPSREKTKAVVGTPEEICEALQNPNILTLEIPMLGLNDMRASMDALSSLLPKSNVASLTIKHCTLDADSIDSLCSAITGSKVSSLILPENDVATKSLPKLFAVLPRSQVRHLDLSRCWIGDSGATALAQVLLSTNLTSLFLECTQIGTDGFRALDQVLLTSSLIRCKLEESESNTALDDMSRGRIDMLDLIFDSLRKATNELSDGILDGSDVSAAARLADRPQLITSVCTQLAQLTSEQEAQQALLRLAETLPPVTRTDIALHTLPLRDALQWLDARGQPLSAADLLNPDGTFPTDRFVCRGGMHALCQQPDLWASSAQAERAIRSLPAVQREILPKHQLFSALRRRDASKQKGRE